MSQTMKLVSDNTENTLLIKNLRQLIQLKKINDAELSRQTKIPPATLNKILSGKTADPRISTLQILADYFEVSLDTLLYGASTPGHKIRSVPIVSWSDCLNDKSFFNELSPSNWKDWITIEYNNPDNIYGLKSKPSMEPRFPKGTILLINSDTQLRDGDLVVVNFKDANEATLRQLSIDGPDTLLLPIGPNASIEKLSASICITGIVIESRFMHYD